ncbi:MAG TPA: hypothetical protein VLI91_13610 [Roseiarcus sp.]|nr:hypothetical protein [Roseiarcus sp.]
MDRARVKVLCVLAALTLAPSSAVAGQPGALCAAAKKPVQAEPLMAAAVAATFGKTLFKATGEDCVYPIKVLHYAAADVLVVQAGEPGEACHGCGAPLSAYVLRRFDDGCRLVRAFRKFATLGTSGAVEDISAVKIGDDDGMAVTSGGTFQGYTSTVLDFFVFRAGELAGLNGTPIIIAADDSGAVVNPGKATEVTAKWSFDPADKTALAIDYTIRTPGASRVERVMWRLEGTSLVLSHGRVPPEVSEASGGG